MAIAPETNDTYAAGQQIAFYPEASTECVRATVETVAADLGIMWIVTEGGKRKILYLHETALALKLPTPQIETTTMVR
jgi:hypothetical protein